MSECHDLTCAHLPTCCSGDCRQGRNCEFSQRLTAAVLLPPPVRRPGFWLVLLAGLWAFVAGTR